jgi:hypothetical protein
MKPWVPNVRFGLACLAAAVLASACFRTTLSETPPPDVVDPLAVGLWQSSTTTHDGHVTISLQTGASFTFDEQDRVSFGYGGTTDKTTLIIVIPNGTHLSYVEAAVAEAGNVYPVGCHPALSILLYDEPGAIVMRVTAPGGADWLPFGIRFRKAASANLRTPSPQFAPWFGVQPHLCLNDVGEVTRIDG